MFKDEYLDGELIDDCNDYYEEESPSYEEYLKGNIKKLKNSRRYYLTEALLLGITTYNLTYKVNKKRSLLNSLIVSATFVGSTICLSKAYSASKMLKKMKTDLKK